MCENSSTIFFLQDRPPVNCILWHSGKNNTITNFAGPDLNVN